MITDLILQQWCLSERGSYKPYGRMSDPHLIPA
jgi:hypothetical protein